MASSTLGKIGEDQLLRLSKYFNYSDEKTKKACELFALISGEWSSWDKSKIWKNYVTEDMSPYSLSVDMRSDVDTPPVLRFVTEPQKEPPTMHSNWEAGIDVLKKLESSWGVDVSRFWKVQDLFKPTSAVENIVSKLYFAIVLDDPIEYKIYFNPNIHGTKKSFSIVKEAYERLGLHDAWTFIANRLEKMSDNTKMPHFALDLSNAETARVKTYFRIESASSLLEILEGYDVNLAALKPFVDNTDVFYPRAVIITFNFDFASRRHHPSVKIHMPAGFYLKDNQRVLNVLSKIQDPTAHGIISRLLSEKIINGGNEKIRYISFHAEGFRNRVTCYMTPRLFETDQHSCSGGVCRGCDPNKEQE